MQLQPLLHSTSRGRAAVFGRRRRTNCALGCGLDVVDFNPRSVGMGALLQMMQLPTHAVTFVAAVQIDIDYIRVLKFASQHAAYRVGTKFCRHRIWGMYATCSMLQGVVGLGGWTFGAP